MRMPFYIDFLSYHTHIGHWKACTEIDNYRVWLEAYAGEEGTGWEWRRGDRTAQGVYIQDQQIAIMFRLKFGI